VKQIVIPLIAAILAGCAAMETRSWGEWISSDIAGTDTDALSILDWSDHPGVIVSIDGVTDVGTGFKKARLRPGKHTISFADYPAEFGIHPKGSFDIEMKPGHRYRFGIQYCYICKPRKYAVWTDDMTNGELVWGSRPDWGWRW